MAYIYSTYDFYRRLSSQIHDWMVDTGMCSTVPALLNDGEDTSRTGVEDAGNAFFRVLERTTRTFDRPPFDLAPVLIDGQRYDPIVAVIDEKPFCRLLHVSKSFPHEQPKLLIVAPLSGHYATLLRDTVHEALGCCDVYLTEWKNARDVPLSEGSFDLDDYIAYIIDFLTILGPKTHVLSVCQPVVPVTAAIALMSAEGSTAVPRSAIMMGGPADTTVSPSAVTRFAAAHSLSRLEKMMITTVPAPYDGRGRRVCPGFLMLACFMSMNPERHLTAHMKYLQNLMMGDLSAARVHEKFYDEYQSVMDLPAEYFLQTIKAVFQEHSLSRGTMVWRGRPVDLGAIQTTALMTVEGEMDDISPPGETEALHRLCSKIPTEQREHHVQAGVGHYGVFSGHVWREQIFPRIVAFIKREEARGA